MDKNFSYFVILGTMRSGSNFLEEQLSLLNNVACYGELFNPVFMGRHNQETFGGIDMVQREAEPTAVLDLLRSDNSTLGGFRYFDGHDPRVLEVFLQDPNCAKIILNRNPLDSYVSLCIAKKTGQWKLTNFTRRKASIADFDADGFDKYLSEVDSFYRLVFGGLTRFGQSALIVDYDDLQNVESFNGILKYLGINELIESFGGKVKKQNPGGPLALVSNPDEMKQVLREDDRFSLMRPLWFEPKRQKRDLALHVSDDPALVFSSFRNSSEIRVVSWIDALNPDGEVKHVPSLEETRLFLGGHRDAVKFGLIEHPLRRCHEVFCGKVLFGKGDGWSNIRRMLKQQHGVDIPAKGVVERKWTFGQHQTAFLNFLRFLILNLKGLTSVPSLVDWTWQASLVEQISDEVCFDMLLKGPRLLEDMGLLSVRLNVDAVEIGPRVDNGLFALNDIVNPEINEAVEEAYLRDFETFGFVEWKPEADLVSS